MQMMSSRARSAENLSLSGAHGVRRAVLGLLATVDAWAERAAERHALQQLDGEALHDLGLSQADVEREAAKPFWRM